MSVAVNQLQVKSKDFKLLGQAALFSIIRTSNPISRTELSQMSGFSIPTITSILDSFRDENLITVSGEGESSGGRRPALFEFNPNAKRVIVLKLSPTRLTLALVNLGGEIIRKTSTPFHYVGQAEEGIAKIIKVITSFKKEHSLEDKNLAGLTVVTPGITDVVDNNWITSAPLKWHNAALGESLKRNFKNPIFLENDAVCSAWAEHQLGITKNSHSITCLTQETGIGIGLIINGQIYRGATGVAGEITHQQGSIEKHACTCGQENCVAPLLLPSYLRERAHKVLGSEIDTQLRQVINNDTDEIPLSLINEALKQGDRFAYTLVSDLGINIAKILVPVINTLNPTVITLSGDYVQFGDVLLNSLNHTIKSLVLTQLSKDLTISLSTLGEDAVLQGAASLCCEAWLAKRDLAPVWSLS